MDPDESKDDQSSAKKSEEKKSEETLEEKNVEMKSPVKQIEGESDSQHKSDLT